jgi:hypothetical protein
MTSGSAPIDDTRVYSQTNDGYHAVNGSATSRTVIAEFIGVSTGSSIIGAFGLGVDPNDLSSADLLLDLLNVNQQPPNNQTFTVSELVVGDRVLVCKNDGANQPDFDEYALQTTLNAAGTTTVVVTGSVAGHTPSTGWLRIQMDTNPTKSGDLGRYRIIAYTSYAISTNTTFQIASTDFSSDVATAGNNIFIGLIDKAATGTSESWTGVYSSDVSLLGRVRDGAEPIVPFDTPATFISSGGGFSAIRNADD